MSTFWGDYFQMWGKSTKSIWRIWWALFRNSINTQKICPPLQCFSVNWSKYPILVGYIQKMCTFWICYFEMWGKFLKSIWRIRWELFRSSFPPKYICSPMQCSFCKLVQMSNFGWLNSANEHILARLFPNVTEIPKFHQANMVGIL